MLLGKKLSGLNIVMFVGCCKNLATVLKYVLKYEGDLKETTVIVGLKRDHITCTNTSAHPAFNDGGMGSTERAFLT